MKTRPVLVMMGAAARTVYWLLRYVAMGQGSLEVDQVGERSHRRPIAAEAVKDDDAHPLIASPTAVVMERRTAMS